MFDPGEQAALDLLTKGWDGFLSGPGRGLLEAALPAWLGRQRWFGAKTRTVAGLHVAQWVQIPVTAAGILSAGSVPAASSLGDVLLLLELRYSDGSQDRYQVPLAFAAGETLVEVRAKAGASILFEVKTPTGPAGFHDGSVREELRQALLGLIERGQALPVEDKASASEAVAATLVAAHESRPLHEVWAGETDAIASAIEELHSIELERVAPGFVGHMPGAITIGVAAEPAPAVTSAEVRGMRSAAFAAVRGQGALTSRLSSAEQSNTNVIYGQRMILKLFRRLQPGLNPDVEIGRFLTEVAQFSRIPPFLGELTLTGQTGSTTLAMLQGLVTNEGDGWEWTQRELAAYYEAARSAGALLDGGQAGTFVSAGRVAGKVSQLAGEYVQAAALLGTRTAEMHLALATPTDNPAFAAEAFSPGNLERDAARVEAQIIAGLDALAAATPGLPPASAQQAAAVLAQREDLLRRAHLVASTIAVGERIRIHGDYHLGQVLRASSDFVLLDFEGEPARTLEERRGKQSPLRDVAGMLRSFSYAAYAGLQALVPELRMELAPWAKAWEAAVSTAFLDSYRATAQLRATLLPGAAEAQALLNAYLLEKALYELLYELNNRPAWLGIPLAGILGLA